MTSLPRVTEYTRERVSREFDDLGPQTCLEEIFEDLRDHNPELLDMAMKCARDVGDPEHIDPDHIPGQIMVGFCMFYRALVTQSAAERTHFAEARTGARLSPLPRVTPETRELMAKEIDEHGAEVFTMDAIEAFQSSNPELLQIAHSFASMHQDYLGIMQGFALLFRSLLAQAAVDRTYMQ